MACQVLCEADLRNKLKEAMGKYRLSEFDIARQLNLSLHTVRAFLNGTNNQYYIEKLVEEWLE